jgi:hypothetical protein
MARDDDFHRWFDAIKTFEKPKLERFAKLELSGRRGSKVRLGQIAAYIEAAMDVKKEGVTAAIDQVCRTFPNISKRKAWEAWKHSATYLNKHSRGQPRPKTCNRL